MLDKDTLISELTAENIKLKTQLAATESNLVAAVTRLLKLENILRKNSGNSSAPPSSNDGIRKKHDIQ
jgi:hypothetical protein